MMFFLEFEIISNSRIDTIDDTLYIFWNVGKQTNGSSRIYFQVKYCPLNIFLERQHCKERNITLCNAFYQGLLNISGSISTPQDELADYTKIGDSKLFAKNVPASVIGKWSETNNEFMCAVYSIDECGMAYGNLFPGSTGAAVQGQILITASTVYDREKKLLDIKQNLGIVFLFTNLFAKFLH